MNIKDKTKVTKAEHWLEDSFVAAETEIDRRGDLLRKALAIFKDKACGYPVDDRAMELSKEIVYCLEIMSWSDK